MSEVQEQLQRIEITIEQAQNSIAREDALNRLTENPDFKRLILDEYFKGEASRQVMLRAAPAMSSDEHQRNINNAITAIGEFNQYLNAISQYGQMARRALESDSKTREELLAEELEGNSSGAMEA